MDARQRLCTIFVGKRLQFCVFSYVKLANRSVNTGDIFKKEGFLKVFLAAGFSENQRPWHVTSKHILCTKFVGKLVQFCDFSYVKLANRSVNTGDIKKEGFLLTSDLKFESLEFGGRT